ncbi:MAG: hypothetical protein HY858_04050 [Candidatus Solibacter usitatus]|nr:hypothetical protein [Candidatus Solibacter usitatus]
MRRAPAVLALLLVCGFPTEARTRSHAHRRPSGLSLRRRLFTSPLITDPGSVDLEFSGAFDTNSSWTLPTTLKYTPLGWRTELSAGVDTLARVVEGSGGTGTHFSDHLNLAATTAFHAGERFSWAFALTLSVFLRNEEGTRIGGAMLGRYDRGRNTYSASASWSGATRVSPSNPAGIFDLTGGYGHKFGRFTPYGTIQFERASGVAGSYAVFEGVEYEVNGRLSLDLNGQHYALNSSLPDHQIVAGLTWNLHRRR